MAIDTKEFAKDQLANDQLAELIAYHQHRYYSGKTEISDAEFDRLWGELQQRDPDHPLLQQIGSEKSAASKDAIAPITPATEATDPPGFPTDSEKTAHIIFMHSQDKANGAAELRAWAEKRALQEFIAQYKLDGVSIELQYEGGVLIAAVTRGDGRRGDTVTANISRAAGVPQTITDSFTGGVRGEVILPLAMHDKHYAEHANCRNTAAGIIKRKDGVGADYLQVICYDAQHRDDSAYFSDNDVLLKWLAAEQFAVVEWCHASDIEVVIGWHEKVSAKRAKLLYEIDGIVVKALPILPDDRQLSKPKYQIAFKFRVQEQQTILREVIWNQAGHQYTPIAITDPVQLAGTTVKRANLVNMRLIRELGLHIGATVAITKRGEIIPKIERRVRAAAKPEPINPPRHCGNCNAEIIVEDTRVYCPNINCPQRIRHQVRRWIEVLEIKDFGEVLIHDLHQRKLLHSVADLYRLQADDIAALPRQGQRSAEKALYNLHQVTNIPLATFIAALNIENIGQKTVQNLIDHGYDSIDALLAMTPDGIVNADGVGEIMAAHICNSLAANRENIMRILEASKIGMSDQTRGVTLKGKSFCLTGALQTMSRKEASAAIDAVGGEVRSSVSAQVSYVVTNDPNANSAKLNQARTHNILIIDEQQFLALLEGRGEEAGDV